ncbi:helix-turn-helix domain-containing protein [Rhodococcus pyridinivorans]|uniref:TetR/AcrR family transcriptional regulator n=1 Tax=Rhodococcus pyridinivorans TaxID=103816 RepID=A0A7M2XN49_9NOCA|nr:TetR/AcrR family transcriptional regulator [Rhodococcus pyridinivorans]QOV99165.1 TetR/AcrR family transcriptional regulator [Rhodococcus pyridinivorans]WMM73108.1 helix-turn-helix domain-containing protein [Rhodococcus pyridinivorans]
MPERAQAGARTAAKTGTPTPTVRRRPKNRKAQIATVAAEAFSERGYHGVSIDEIATAVGISGPALYRHFPNKYALFHHAVVTLADALGAALAEFDEQSGANATGLAAAEELERKLLALIRTTIENRRTGGLYRWERRYLTGEDHSEIRSKTRALNRHLARTAARLRPDLTDDDYVLLGSAMLSVIGSITTHRVPLSNRRLQQLLLDACTAVAATDLVPDIDEPAPTPEPGGLSVANKREVLLHEAVLLFDARGYHEVSIEEIGAAAGINASGVYRHFASKADLLAAAFHRAGDRVAMIIGETLTDSTTSAQALDVLTEAYVRMSFENSELMSVYFAEIGNLPAHHRSDLRNIQRLNIEEWARLVGELRPELPAVECRFLVHAALNLVLDTGNLVHFLPTPSRQRRVQQLMLSVLLGDTGSPEAVG